MNVAPKEYLLQAFNENNIIMFSEIYYSYNFGDDNAKKILKENNIDYDRFVYTYIRTLSGDEM